MTGGQARATAARVLGAHYKAVARWVRAARKPGGVDAQPQPAPTPGRTGADLRALEGLLAKGAKARGRPHQLWTAARVARLIERAFRIRYHPGHVRNILKRRLGWTGQKPRREARERNDREVARWVDDDVRRIARGAFGRGAYLAFPGESGSHRPPTARRTLAPPGGTPVLDAWGRRGKGSAISCVTLGPVAARPGLHFDLLGHDVHGEDVVAPLAELHRRVGPGGERQGRTVGPGGGRAGRGEVPPRPAPGVRPADRPPGCLTRGLGRGHPSRPRAPTRRPAGRPPLRPLRTSGGPVPSRPARPRVPPLAGNGGEYVPGGDVDGVHDRMAGDLRPQPHLSQTQPPADLGPLPIRLPPRHIIRPVLASHLPH